MRTKRLLTWTAAATVCALGACHGRTPAPAAQPIKPAAPERGTIADANGSLVSSMTGVFTAEQARLGADIYAGTCRSCHMGAAQTAAFRKNWTGYPLSELWTYIAVEMPQNAPGSLSPEDNTLVVAYLLQLTGMPAGKAALPTDIDGLSKIRFDTLSGGRVFSHYR